MANTETILMWQIIRSFRMAEDIPFYHDTRQLPFSIRQNISLIQYGR